MQACSGAAALQQQPVWKKGMAFPSKSLGFSVSQNQVRVVSFGPCRSSLEGSLVTGKPPASVSVSVPEIGGKIVELY